MRIHVIDNGGQWTHREWRVLSYLDIETEIIQNSTPFDELAAMDLDGLVLSGGAARIHESSEDMGLCGDYLDKASFPVLGICAGHQYIALHFGGALAACENAEFGTVDLCIDDAADPLFAGVPAVSKVWESHNDEVTVLPPDFIALAHSDNCTIQAMRHTTRPIYGIQFHPEVEHTQYGEQIFKNFIALCAARKR